MDLQNQNNTEGLGLKSLIKDFYAKYEPEKYSDEQVAKIEDFYKGDANLLIKDFYAKYDPEKYNDEQVNKVVSFYGLKKKVGTEELPSVGPSTSEIERPDTFGEQVVGEALKLDNYIVPEAVNMAAAKLSGTPIQGHIRLSSDQEIDEWNKKNPEVSKKITEDYEKNRQLLEDVTYNIPKEELEKDRQRATGEYSYFMTGIRDGVKGRQIANDDTYFIARTDNDQDRIDHFEDEYIRAIGRVGDQPEMLSKEGIGNLIGGQLVPIIKTGGSALLAGFLSGPIGAAVAGGSVGSTDAAITGFGAAYRQAYFEARSQGMDQKQADEAALKLAWAGAVGGGFEGSLAAIPGFGKLAAKITTKPLSQAATRAIIDLGIDAGAAGLSQIGQNKVAQAQGLERNTFDGVSENMLAEGLFSAGMNVGYGLLKTPGAIRDYANSLPKAEQQKVETAMVKNQAKVEANAGKSISDDYVKQKEAEIQTKIDNQVNTEESTTELEMLKTNPVEYATKERDALQSLLDRGRVPEDQVAGIKSEIDNLNKVIKDASTKEAAQVEQSKTKQNEKQEDLQEGETTEVVEVNEPDVLKDVESTQKALDAISQGDMAPITELSELIGNPEATTSDIASEYQKSKQDGTNPELVSKVENLLIPKETKYAEEQQVGEMREQGSAVGEGQGDINQDMPEVNGAELQDGEEVKVKKAPKTKMQKRIDTAVEGKAKGEKTVVNDWVEFKRSLREREKAGKAGIKEGKQEIKTLQNELKGWLKESSGRINSIRPIAKASILKRVASITTEKQLNNTIQYIENVLTNKEYYNDSVNARQLRSKIKQKAKAKKGRNIFGDHYHMVQDALMIDPTNFTPEEVKVYNQYMQEAYNSMKANSRTPDIAPLANVLREFKDRIEVETEEIRTAKTYNKLEKAFDNLENITEVEDIATYRKVLNSARQIEYQAGVLLREGKINESEYNLMMTRLDDLYTNSENSSLEAMSDEFKSNLISEAKDKAKAIDVNNWEKEKASKISDFLNIPVYALEAMSIKDIDSYNRIMDMLDSGVVGSEMYDVLRRAEAIKVQLPLVDYFNDVKNTDRFKKLKEKSLKEMKNLISTTKSYRIDLDLFGSVSNRALKRLFYAPIDNATSTISNKESEILSPYIQARKDLKKSKGMNKAKVEKLDKQIGFLFGLKDWMSNKVVHYVDGGKREYDWADAPDEIKNKWDYKFDQMKKQNTSTLKMEDILADEDIWSELKANFNLNSIKDVDAAIDALSKNEKVKKYIQSVQSVLSDVRNFTQVSTENRGKVWEERNNYFPAYSKETTYKDTKSLFEDVDSVVGKMNGSRLSVEAGSTNRRTNENYYTETNVSRIISKAVKESLTDYYLTPAMRSVFSGMTKAGRESGNVNVAKALNDSLLDLIKVAVNKREIEEAEKGYNRVLKYTKWMTLSRPERPPVELFANGFRSFISEGVGPNDYKEAMKPAYGDILKRGVVDDKFSQYQEEIGDEKIDESKLKKATRALVTFADTIVGKATFTKVFGDEFKKLTGESFDADKYVNDPAYRKKFDDEIMSARVDAISRVEELFNSKTPTGSPTAVSFFGKTLRKDNTITSLLFYMQSFNQNEFEQVRDSVYRLFNNRGDSAARVKGMRDIVSIVGSNYLYMQGVVMMGVIYRALVQDLIDEDDKPSVKAAVEKYYDDNFNQEKVFKKMAASLVSLATGKNTNTARLAVSLGLGMMEEMAKTSGADKEDWYKAVKEQVSEFSKDAYYAKPFKQRASFDDHMSMFLPGVGQTIGAAIDAGYDIVKIGSTPREELLDDYEKYLYDLLQISNMVISYMVMNPVSPILNKLTGYAQYETDYMAGKLLRYDDGLNDDIMYINDIVRRNELYDDPMFKSLKSIQKKYKEVDDPKDKKYIIDMINKSSSDVLKHLNQKEMEINLSKNNRNN